MKFRTPLFTDHSKVPENLDFKVNLNVNGEIVSEDLSPSITIPHITGKPIFTKYSNSSSVTVNNEKQYIMSKDKPGTNNFVLLINYDQGKSYENLVIKDQLPSGLKLRGAYSIFPNAIGNSADVQFIKIYKLTFDTDGNRILEEYVTEKFADSITSTEDSFSVDFGRIEADESYAISYGASVSPEYDESNFGVQYNNARMINDNKLLYTRKIPLIMNKTNPGSSNLKKSVNISELSTNKSVLAYSLKLTNNLGELKAGTIVTGPLPVNTSYLATQKHDDFSDATYDLIKNTISYTLLKDIPPGESRDIEFTVDYDDSNAQIGQSVVNKASYTYAGTDIYSNDATTLISGSAELQKLDKENNNPLEGAHFKIVDSFGNLILDNLVTDSNGIVRAGLLKPGNYSFIETRAPEGYVLDPKPNDFSVSEGQTVAIKLMMYNEKEIPVKPVDPIKPIKLVDVSKSENQKQSIKSKKEKNNLPKTGESKNEKIFKATTIGIILTSFVLFYNKRLEKGKF
ncbi:MULTISPECIES: SpaA isopeptide-forming pilin-related protein [Carnobacterium]|uniref:SpaA isopeptide-forming pilin-related protein n=1 Tax=Carnobacterium TaxID=2747 RepID=UPI00288E80FA|nr:MULTISPECIES: SpaA isopeptide-forming pilin-related protein [Carnobacterium]MDT1938859.1 SpaA isopeptide-forming pilin-related protein [Carnobacterium divergens]MDT1941297.1 SpaA isopeptide-forming pilin-related protein [Carnobacterium divergens]MDT1947095.1 SpaA isopeptide-forming pilin-related protein [Carnobacterium divergens]MDT1949533.1 SpaA isopeptide-forming pilin-related protein [Carnobacterium divergens]MDT1954711.1 SpaA isopeptide-forming pilin-related protein [Carnobacterium dive